MAKKKVKEVKKVKSHEYISQDLIKEFGDSAFITGDQLVDESNDVIRVSPRIDLLLGGGIPGGSVVTLAGDPKCGKGQPLDSIVWTPQGPKTMGEIQIGDKVCTENGISNIVGIYPQGKKQIYEIKFADGDTCKCDIDHLWEVKAQQRNKSEILSTKQLLEYGLRYSDRLKWSIILPEPIQFNSQDVSIDPYLLGCLLGDGCITQKDIRFSNIDHQILNKVSSLLPFGYELVKVGTSGCDYRVKSNGKQNEIRMKLEEYELLGKNSHTKFIPKQYKFNSKEIRLQILQGLMDTDGSVSKRGWCEFTTTSMKLANDIKLIVQSLGGICTIKNRTTSCDNKKFASYRCGIRLEDTSILFQLDRKKQRTKKRTRGTLCRRIKSIQFVGTEQSQCIKVNTQNGLYLTNNFIVTHNTVTTLHILGKAQEVGRPVFFINVEGRIKPRDLDGIACLDQSKLHITRSYRDKETGQTKIFKAHEFLKVAEDIVNNTPHAVIVIDSISALVTDGEMTNELDKKDRAPGASLMAKFCRRISNVVSVNDTVVIGILHYYANTSGYGKAKLASGGTKIKYAMDIGMECKAFRIIREGNVEDGRPIGQEIDWVTTSTAFAPPGQKATSILTYGTGLDEMIEMVEMGIEIGLILQGGSWFKLMYMEDHVGEKEWDLSKFQVQGKERLINRLRQNEDERLLLEKTFYEMMDV